MPRRASSWTRTPRRSSQMAASPRPTRLERLGTFASKVGSARPDDPNLRRALYAAITLVVFLSVALAAAGALQRLNYVQNGVRPEWLVAGILGFVVLALLGAELWHRLLGALGSRPPRLKGTW